MSSYLVEGFQSSPTGEGGRDVVTEYTSGMASAFQSSPTGEGGRDLREAQAAVVEVDVSILAHR